VAKGALADETLPIPDADRVWVENAVPRRRAEYVAGRWCAHEALHAIGLRALSLPAGLLGAPRWPAGVVGSITHDAGYCLAVAGPASSLVGVGIDWCDDDCLGTVLDLANQVLAPSERGALALSGDPARHLQRVFCAKEAVVKAVSATLGRFLDLHEITVDSVSGAFEARISGRCDLVRGKHLSVQRHALAWAALLA
jgi:4'-phosphopantetheinyl transferase EntD